MNESNNNKIIDWLKQDLDLFKKVVKEDFDTLNEKMDSMLQFKWQIVGGSLVVSLIVGLAMQLLLGLIKQ